MTDTFFFFNQQQEQQRRETPFQYSVFAAIPSWVTIMCGFLHIHASLFCFIRPFFTLWFIFLREFIDAEHMNPSVSIECVSGCHIFNFFFWQITCTCTPDLNVACMCKCICLSSASVFFFYCLVKLWTAFVGIKLKLERFNVILITLIIFRNKIKSSFIQFCINCQTLPLDVKTFTFTFSL